jgi:N-acetylmuramoyl-L-alanine amidase
MKKSLSVLFVFSAFLFVPFLQAKAAVTTSLGHSPTGEAIKVLLVPGHDNDVWGTQYGDIKEADMTLALATRIYNILKKDKRFDVHVTRDSQGYTKEFADYFSLQRDQILAFKENAKKEMKDKITNGDFIERENVVHNTVTENISVILYGINKWANENKMDMILHIHFNDYPREWKWTIGKYKGFVVYMPDEQMANWMESGKLAAYIYVQLAKKYISSTYEKELGGLVPDQKLIALGSNGTLASSVRSVLVEYGYIYEKRFRTNSARLQSYKDMSTLTVQGIQNYFSSTQKPILTPNPSP